MKIIRGGYIYQSRVVYDDDSIKAIAEKEATDQVGFSSAGSIAQRYRDGLELKHLAEGWKGCFFISGYEYTKLTKVVLAPLGWRINPVARGGHGHGAALPKDVEIVE